MVRVTLAAIRARRSQAAILFALTALALGTATAAPWYVLATARSVTLAGVTAADPGYLAARVANQIAHPAGGPASGAELIRLVHEEGSAAITVPGAEPSAALWLPGRAIGTAPARVDLAHREGVCGHLILDGACPTAAGEALLSQRTAVLLGVTIGDEVVFETSAGHRVALEVVGRYRLREPFGAYWALSELGTPTGSDAAAGGVGDPILVTADAMAALPTQRLSADYHLVLPAEAFLGPDGYDLGADLARQRELRRGWRLETNAPALASRIAEERRLLNLGVGIAAAQLLLLCWCALFFAVRHTAQRRRADVGLLKLRGASRWRVWWLATAQSALPMVAGAFAGAAAGAAAAWLLPGEIGDPARAARAFTLSGVAAGVALGGALAAVVLADARWMGHPVAELMRRVPARRSWRSGAVDLVLVTLAAAGIYQAYAGTAGTGEATGVVVLAPALIAVVVALAAARLVGPLAVRTARRALRAGRLPGALVATSIARRPGTHRVLALLAVAVSIFTTAVAGWQAGGQSRDLRAAHDVGADQVLTVQARSRAHLLAATRAVDPDGRYAMAVVRNPTAQLGEAVLAVDSPRFATVARVRPEYHPAGLAGLSALLRPAAPEPIRVGDGELTLVASGPPVLVVARLVSPAGETIEAVFGPLGAEPTGHRTTVAGCGGSGCRLAGLGLFTRSTEGKLVEAGAGLTVRVEALDGAAGPVLAAAELGDVRLWHSDLAPDVLRTGLTHDGGRLTMVSAPNASAPGQRRSTWAHLSDAPAPLPMLRAGGAVPEAVPGDPRLLIFEGIELPVRLVAQSGSLPRSSTRGGYLVDLEYADRLAPGEGGAGDVLQVWLGPDAPSGTADLLVGQGLTILDTETIPETLTSLNNQGPPAAARFQVAAGLIGLLMAAGALVVAAAVERPDRAGELAALRAQGMSVAPVRRIAHGGPWLLAVLAVLLGVAASVLGQAVLPAAMPAFVDNWAVLPLPTVPAPGATLCAAATGLVVLGAPAALTAVALVRAVAARSRPGSAGTGEGA